MGEFKKDIVYTIIMAGFFVINWAWKKWEASSTWKKIRKDLPEKLDTNSMLREKILLELYQIVAIVRANRANLFEYSNGTYSHADVGQQYINCTSEATDDNTKGIIKEFVNVPIGKFIQLINRIKNSKTGWDKASKNDSDPFIAKLQREHRVETTYSFRLSEVIWEGVISISWVHKDVVLSEDTIKEVQTRIAHIAKWQSQLKRKQ